MTVRTPDGMKLSVIVLPMQKRYLIAAFAILPFSNALSQPQQDVARASQPVPLVQRIKKAQANLHGAATAIRDGDRERALRSYDEALYTSLDAMEQMKALLYIQLLKTQGKLDAKHTAELKEIDELAVASERILRDALEGSSSIRGSEEIEIALKSVLTRYPDNRFVLEYLARHYEKQHRWDEVIATCQKILQSYTRSQYAHLALGRAYETKSHDANAILAYQRALEIDDQDSTIYEALGRLYHRAGKKPEWIAYLQRNLRLNPRNALVVRYLNQAGQAEPDTSMVH